MQELQASLKKAEETRDKNSDTLTKIQDLTISAAARAEVLTSAVFSFSSLLSAWK